MSPTLTVRPVTLIAGFIAMVVEAVDFDTSLPLLATLIALPWIVLCLVNLFKPALSIWGGRTGMAVVLVGPGIALSISAIRHFAILEWRNALVVSIIGAVAVTLAMPLADSDNRPRGRTLALAAFLLLPYGFGTGTAINDLFDGVPPTIYAPQILDKYIVPATDRWGNPRYVYYFTVAPWGTQKLRHEVSVPTVLYQELKVGDRLCIGSHAGALRIPWYAPTTCPEQDAIP